MRNYNIFEKIFFVRPLLGIIFATVGNYFLVLDFPTISVSSLVLNFIILYLIFVFFISYVNNIFEENKIK